MINVWHVRGEGTPCVDCRRLRVDYATTNDAVDDMDRVAEIAVELFGPGELVYVQQDGRPAMDRVTIPRDRVVLV